MEIKKISADLIYQNSMERTANRPTEASRFGRGGMNPSQVKANYDQLALRAIEKVNEIISAVNGDGEESLAAIMKTPITDPDNDQVSLTLYDVLKGISNGEIAEYLKLNGLLEDTLLDELKRLEVWSGEQRDLAAKDVFDMIKDDPNFKGKDAYEAAKEGGYLGSEEEFYKKLAQESNISVTSVNGKTGAVVLNHEDVGADKSGAAAGAVSEHNVDDESHNDIRLALKDLADRINDALDSDDATLDELHEIVAYIKSNKTLIDAITTSKVNVSDIVNNLVSNVANKPLSAAQGVVLKSLVDEAKLFITPQMFGAKGDGVADDTAAIQAALDTASLIYIPDGVYMINATNSGWGHQYEGGVKPKSNQTIILSQNATLKAISNSTGFYNIINLVSVENVHIKGGKVQGDKANHGGTGEEYGYGVNIVGSKNITIEQMEVFDCWGDSVLIGYVGEVNSSNVKILNCVLHDSRRQGISVIGCNTAFIQGCDIYNISGTAPQYGIDIEPDGTGVATNIVIDSCHIHDCTGGSVVIQTGDAVANTIKSVKVTNSHLDKATCTGGEDVVFECDTIGWLGHGLGAPTSIRSGAEFLKVDNCDIKELYLGGNVHGRFDNCRFVGETDAQIISIDASDNERYPSGSYIFNDCFIKTTDTATYLIKGPIATIVDGKRALKTLKFSSCHIELGDIFANTYEFGEMVFDGCDITFKGSPWEMFGLRSGAGQRLVIRDTVATCLGEATYLINVENNTGYEIEIYNSRLTPFKNFLWGYAESGGIIRLSNNILSKTNIVTAQGFTFAPMYVTDAELASKGYLTSVPSEYVTETELTNKGYLTLNSLPKYDGGVS